MPDKDPCSLIKGWAKKYCEGDPPANKGGGGPPSTEGGGITNGASDHVKELADSLINAIKGMLAPQKTWAPQKSDNFLYQQFLWLGQHLAIAILVCVIVVCALTAWQGEPRLKQLGASTGWTLAAVAGMASVPGVVVLLNKAVSATFQAAFNSNESTLFKVIEHDLDTAVDSGNPLALLIIISALVVALAFAALVFMTRNPGILAFVCMAPLVLASMARGGETSAVRAWAMRLLGLMFAPLALLLITPFVQMAKGSLVMDAVLLVAADVLMLRMIFHGIPYFGPKIAGAARAVVESRTTNPIVRAAVRAGSPDFYEQENNPHTRTVDTPGRAAHTDRGVLFAAYGVTQKQRSARLTTKSAIDKSQREAPRAQQLIDARRAARAAAQTTTAGAPRNPNRPPRPNPNRPTRPTPPTP
ncbi:hypothetical protein [Streptomyces sp. NBC_00342]|uniref:hypothetical protein n=1 Tax=Streptomyces sp. NBC_00342 TaxID=2975718 RepID=UPI002E2BED93|nr:hypothetical protein [Streptomyces sp. NBC_00342]